MNLKETAGGPKISFNILLQDLISDYVCIFLSFNPSLTGAFSVATNQPANIDDQLYFGANGVALAIPTGAAPAISSVTGWRVC